MNKESKAALDQIKGVYDDGEATINGRTYTITKLTHSQRVQVFAFFSSIKDDLQRGDFSFMTTPEFKKVEKIINQVILFEDSGLDKLNGHWDEYPEDYIMYISTFLSVISYPFLKGSLSS